MLFSFNFRVHILRGGVVFGGGACLFFIIVCFTELMFFSPGGLPYSQLVHDQVCQEVVAPGAIAGQRLRINHPVTVTIISVIIFCAIGYVETSHKCCCKSCALRKTTRTNHCLQSRTLFLGLSSYCLCNQRSITYTSLHRV